MKRRQFLTNTSLATAGILTSQALVGCGTSTKTETVSKSKLDKIGFQIYTVREQVKDNLEPTLEKLAGYGYDYVELYGLGDGNVLGHPADFVKKACVDAGIEIRSIHCGTGHGTDTPGTMINDWQRAVDTAAELGGKHVVCAYLVDDERKNLDDYKYVVELLNKCGEATAKSGIQMGYHNHAFEFEAVEGEIPMHFLMGQTDPDLVKFELDIYWSTVAKQSAVDLFKRYSGRINLWHVKDMNKADTQMTEVGNGRIDWPSIFAQAELSGMTGFFVEQDGNWTNSDIESLGASHQYLANMEF